MWLKNKREAKGITLLALVITIILIIILAVVAINFAFGENGLITKAQQGKQLHDIEYTREKLGAVLVDALVEKKLNAEYNQDDFLDDFIYAREPEAEATDDEISLNGHTFELDRSVPQLGEYIGEAGNLPPRIRRVEVTNQTYSEVSVEVTTARADGATFRYSFKKNEEGDSSYQGNVEQAQNTYTFSNLETLVVYNLRVELIKDGAVVDTEVINVILGELEEGSLTFGQETWSSGTASLPVSTTTNNQIQYQINTIDEDGWTTISGSSGNIQSIPNGATVFARLWDGTRGSEYISRTIVDEDPPVIDDIIEVEKTFDSIKVQVDATDAKSGIAKIEYSSDDGASYVTGASDTATEYEFTGLQMSTEYTIKVRVTDNANNVSEASKVISTAGEVFSDIYSTTTEYTDSEGNKAWIPGGFAVGVSEGINTVNDGLVITDKVDENNYSIGNEFVWVPVTDQDLNEMYQTSTGTKLSGVNTTTSVYSKLRNLTSGTVGTPGSSSSNRREPDLVTSYDTSSTYYSILGYESAQEMAEGLVDEYEATYESIQKYDGFYIGRYELTGTVDNPTIKPRQTVLTAATAGNWYYLKRACSNIVTGSSYAQSTMIYGNQWDETLDWFVDTGAKTSSEVYTSSASWGNYNNSRGTPRPSRYNEAWQTKNIYDMAGNYWDWTQEAYGTYLRTGRGGYYNDSGSGYPASYRGSNGSHLAYSDYSSRPALYVK